MESLCWCPRQHVFPYWKSIVIILVPLLLSPLVISGGQEAKVGFVMITMTIYWMSGTLPLAVTGLIPVVSFPMLGVMDTAQICSTYFNECNMIILGSLIVGLCVENSNLHQRMALRVVLWVGTDPKMLLLGIMLVTMSLSMWVDNTATTSMILPMADVLVGELIRDDEEDGCFKLLPTTTTTTTSADGDAEVESGRGSADSAQRQKRLLRVYLYLAVPFSASIGGNGTLNGNTPTLVLKGISDDFFGAESTISFTSYMAIGVPTMIINLLILWGLFTVFLFGFGGKAQDSYDAGKMKKAMQVKYEELGPMSYHEKTVFALFVVLINLWVWRDPKFVPGWGSLFSKKIGDALPVIFISLVLFVLPMEPNFWCWRTPRPDGKVKANKSMIDWATVQKKVPWGLLLMIGGGIGCAEAAKISGLSKLMGEQLGLLESLPKFAIMLIICTFIGVLTEAVSNAAMANIFLPVLAQTAQRIAVHPMYLMVPAAAMCNYVFILPVGTAPNALAFEMAKWKLSDTLKIGCLFKVLNTLVVCVVMETLGQAVLIDLPQPEALASNFTSLPS